MAHAGHQRGEQGNAGREEPQATVGKERRDCRTERRQRKDEGARDGGTERGTNDQQDDGQVEKRLCRLCVDPHFVDDIGVIGNAIFAQVE